jgi:hypothetical protein
MPKLPGKFGRQFMPVPLIFKELRYPLNNGKHFKPGFLAKEMSLTSEGRLGKETRLQLSNLK